MIRVRHNYLELYCNGENYGDIAIEKLDGVNGPIAHVHCEIYIWTKSIIRRLLKDKASGFKYIKQQGFVEVLATNYTLDEKWKKFCKLLDFPNPIACVARRL